jgi:phospholipase/lecithinase/hemolysin
MTGKGPESPSGNVWSDEFPNLSGTDISSQVEDYLRDNQGAADPAALYILEGGANDLPLLTNPSQTVINLVWTFLKLQQSGARHVVIVLLPDVGTMYPIIAGEQNALLAPGTAANYSSTCIAINLALRAAMSALTAPGVTVTFADFARFCDGVAADPSAYGMKEVRLPYSRATGGQDPATFLFWDDYHPTTRAHELFADRALDGLLATYPGLPIAVPMLGIGR